MRTCTNTIMFCGPTAVGKSSYIEKLKRQLQDRGYSVEVIYTHHGEEAKERDPKVDAAFSNGQPRFLFIHHCRPPIYGLGLDIGFLDQDGAMDLWTALDGEADPLYVGFEKKGGAA